MDFTGSDLRLDSDLKVCDLKLNVNVSHLTQDLDEGKDLRLDLRWELDFTVSGFRLFRVEGK